MTWHETQTGRERRNSERSCYILCLTGCWPPEAANQTSSNLFRATGQIPANPSRSLLSAQLTVKASAKRTQGQTQQRPRSPRPILSCTPFHLSHLAVKPSPGPDLHPRLHVCPTFDMIASQPQPKKSSPHCRSLPMVALTPNHVCRPPALTLRERCQHDKLSPCGRICVRRVSRDCMVHAVRPCVLLTNIPTPPQA